MKRFIICSLIFVLAWATTNAAPIRHQDDIENLALFCPTQTDPIQVLDYSYHSEVASPTQIVETDFTQFADAQGAKHLSCSSLQSRSYECSISPSPQAIGTVHLSSQSLLSRSCWYSISPSPQAIGTVHLSCSSLPNRSCWYSISPSTQAIDTIYLPDRHDLFA